MTQRDTWNNFDSGKGCLNSHMIVISRKVSAKSKLISVLSHFKSLKQIYCNKTWNAFKIAASKGHQTCSTDTFPHLSYLTEFPFDSILYLIQTKQTQAASEKTILKKSQWNMKKNASLHRTHSTYEKMGNILE